jgi:RNA polymerase sigma-70 factor (ECF subfamily)
VEREPSDGEIIAASADDGALFGVVFDRHFPRIHRYLARRVGSALADELAAETFVAAFRVRQKFDLAATDARPWLFGIAANLVRRHWRAERRQLRAYARTGLDPVGDELTDAERRVDAAAQAPRLAAALASLSRADREVLLLFSWAELSYEEIAVAVAIPVGTVRSRLSRARRRMREALEASAREQLQPARGSEPDPADRRIAIESATEGGHHG